MEPIEIDWKELRKHHLVLADVARCPKVIGMVNHAGTDGEQPIECELTHVGRRKPIRVTVVKNKHLKLLVPKGKVEILITPAGVLLFAFRIRHPKSNRKAWLVLNPENAHGVGRIVLGLKTVHRKRGR